MKTFRFLYIYTGILIGLITLPGSLSATILIATPNVSPSLSTESKEISPGVIKLNNRSLPDPKEPNTDIKNHESGLYALNAGDIIEISIYNREDSDKMITIDPSGSISYMFAGSVKAAGKTIPQLKQELQSLIGLSLRDPIVNILPVELKSRRFSIMGALSNPGTYQLTGTICVLDAIAMANGLKTGLLRENTVQLADLDHAFLLRNKSYVPVNFKKLLHEGSMKENISLQAGDYLYIPESHINEITLLGEVNAPGYYEYADSLSVIQAVVLAKGFNNKAQKDSIIILRGSLTQPVVYRVNTEKIINGEIMDFVLESKDIVYIPRRTFYSLEEATKTVITTFVQAFATADNTKLFNAVPEPETK
ncbi:MAG TPA: hypothetical protein DF296_05710 [Candidatus Margulisbacteria bacterium]|nr:MAG: hypothetical protein A2X43_04360 [Candidatus Margulisbacteria bacterium GWD2_39_127]OGI04058.1 MAG: hypothetical protein A2X42_11140 [Candidatus Margulisbacteria bacterium GWF2_38_17]OGI06001.1 MAG: hypothetical protein A2X41_12315 [Candidatus Margulisbacteria bacterium GWE2_39_32]HAR63405.1 hypothetical protein [Candidatus Margulisiibacteriota bacterium]HCT84677.1 hypothetical protein [Candidatus Margulisiibacteriota bacterium]